MDKFHPSLLKLRITQHWGGGGREVLEGEDICKKERVIFCQFQLCIPALQAGRGTWLKWQLEPAWGREEDVRKISSCKGLNLLSPCCPRRIGRKEREKRKKNQVLRRISGRKDGEADSLGSPGRSQSRLRPRPHPAIHSRLRRRCSDPSET